MPFLLLLFLTLACLPDRWRKPPDWVGTPARSALFTTVLMAMAVGAAAQIAWMVRRQLAEDPSRRSTLLRRYGTWRFYHLLGLFAAFAVCLYLLGWGWAVLEVCHPGLDEARANRLPDSPAGPLTFFTELILLFPFLTALVLSWTVLYDAERALHAAAGETDSFWSRWAYVGFHVRHNLALVVIPLSLLVVQKGLGRLMPAASTQWQTVVTLLGALLAIGVFIGMPWILRLVLGLTPLPDCPLRQRLMATARRLNFRFSNLLLWNTRGGVANAMVAGILPIPRYVLLTDRLVTDLDPDEVEAVFGHEIGHVKHRHMLYYFSFLLLSLVVLWGTLALFLPETMQEDLRPVPLVGALGAYIFVVFGFLSRRCERQADIYGCRAVSCGKADCGGHADGQEKATDRTKLCTTGIHTFISALEKVALLNGISRDRPGWLQSWQHSTIARRVDFLQRMQADSGVELRFQRTVGLVKWGLLVTLSACLAVLYYVHS